MPPPESAVGCSSRDKPLSSMAERFAAGRTAPRLLHLMEMAFLRKPVDFGAGHGLVPTAGIFAKLCGQYVFIIRTFERRGLPLADVAPLRLASTRWECHFREVPLWVGTFRFCTV